MSLKAERNRIDHLQSVSIKNTKFHKIIHGLFFNISPYGVLCIQVIDRLINDFQQSYNTPAVLIVICMRAELATAFSSLWCVFFHVFEYISILFRNGSH